MQGRQLLAAWRTTGATTALQEAAMPDTMARLITMVVAILDVRLVLRASSRLHQAMEWRALCVLLVLAASIRAALRRLVRTKQPHVPLVQQDMAVMPRQEVAPSALMALLISLLWVIRPVWHVVQMLRTAPRAVLARACLDMGETQRVAVRFPQALSEMTARPM